MTSPRLVRSLLSALAIALCTSGDVQAAPDGARLVRAVRARDAAEVERLGRALGTRGLTKLLASTTRAERVAALEAAPTPEDAWALLPRLAELAGARDHDLAAGAARAMSAIARGLPRDEMLLADAPPDELGAAAVACARLARRPERWADVRVVALECAVRLGLGLADDAPQEARTLALELVADVDPEVRRAAVGLVEITGDASRRRVLDAVGDPVPAVAATALATLCAFDAAVARTEIPTARATELTSSSSDAGLSVQLRRCFEVPRGKRGRR